VYTTNFDFCLNARIRVREKLVKTYTKLAKSTTDAKKLSSK